MIMSQSEETQRDGYIPNWWCPLKYTKEKGNCF